jgi:hypothetical protein
LGLAWCVICLLLALVSLVLILGLMVEENGRRRVLPLLLTLGCGVTFVGGYATGISVELHLMGRIYLAGGPNKLSEWAQGEIRAHNRAPEGKHSGEPSDIPSGVRNFLPGHASVGGTIWSDLPRVRIELGGGFYHYGVVVYPKEAAPPPAWWQRLIGWPPEVVVYHGD